MLGFCDHKVTLVVAIIAAIHANNSIAYFFKRWHKRLIDICKKCTMPVVEALVAAHRAWPLLWYTFIAGKFWESDNFK
jgi:hypothetical protein